VNQQPGDESGLTDVQQTSCAIYDLQRFDLFARGCAQFFETASGHQYSSFKRADGFVVRLHRFVQSFAYLREVLVQNPKPIVKMSTEFADLLSVFGHALLLPAVCDGFEQSDESRRRCKDDALIYSKLDQ